MEEVKFYINHLPYAERKQLCVILDQDNRWEELAGNHMRYDAATIYLLRQEMLRGKSPTDELLTLWGQQNHTAFELFVLLIRMRHYQGMMVIKNFVAAPYHKLIRKVEKDINKPINDTQLERIRRLKDGQIPEKNFHKIESKHLQENKDMQTFLRSLPQQKDYVTRDDNYTVVLPEVRVGISRTLEISDISSAAGIIPQIPYENLRKSTDNWNEAKVLGRGGFGVVFEGIWKSTKVAIKKIEEKTNSSESRLVQMRQSITELYCLNAYRHDNILALYGYSIGGPQQCLVYQYMSGGSLDNRLRATDGYEPLKWRTRVDIAIGTARGLQYLHIVGNKPLIHGDIKSANVLLDHNDVAKIGDFGLSREGPESGLTHVTVSRIMGTRPYLPDEFLRGRKLSTKVDTYSFGVVLFELATGLGAYSTRRRYKFLKDHVVWHEGDVLDLKDKRVDGFEEYFKGLLDLGRLCVTTNARDRPEMVDVLIRLENVL